MLCGTEKQNFQVYNDDIVLGSPLIVGPLEQGHDDDWKKSYVKWFNLNWEMPKTLLYDINTYVGHNSILLRALQWTQCCKKNSIFQRFYMPYHKSYLCYAWPTYSNSKHVPSKKDSKFSWFYCLSFLLFILILDVF